MLEEIKIQTKKFTSTSLKEMNSVALMKRTDTKYIIHKNHLSEILEKIKDNYSILEINDNRIMTYKSLYFDTDVKKFYFDHHNGKKRRTKIRMRKYVESDLCFLEIKQKDPKGKTSKTRIPVKDFEQKLSNNSKKFIENTTTQSYKLTPIIWNKFNRFTLVNNSNKERVTVDLNITFTINGAKKTFKNLVIIEVKQENFNRNTAITKALKQNGYHQYSISKYCIGIISLYNNVKYNSFKQKLLKINNLKA